MPVATHPVVVPGRAPARPNGTAEKSGTFLLRFDDICPTMNWRIWNQIETVLVAKNIRPILAIVPENRDPQLVVGPPATDFWHRARKWQEWGWAIGLHGYQHRYVNRNGGILKIPTKSEFAGLSRQEQEGKLRAGLGIFAAEGIRACAWVAPSHSFDETTVQLLPEVGIRILSDGFSLFPFQTREGVTWVPQQLWDLRPRRQGVWTVCFHPNEWDQARCDWFAKAAEAFRPNIGTLQDVVSRWRGRAVNFRDRLNAALIKARFRIGPGISTFRELLSF